MPVDPATQKILDVLGGIRGDLKLLAQRIDELSKCKNNHEERVRNLEISTIDKEDHQAVLNEIKAIQVSQAKNIAYVSVVLTLVFILIQWVFKVG